MDVQEYTQSALAIIVTMGGGYLLAFHPELDRALVVAMVGPILGFYFGARVNGRKD